MHVKNRSDLLNLARDESELQILKKILDYIDFTIDSAQPSKFLTSSINLSDEFMEFEEKRFEFSSFNNIYLLSFGKASQSMTEWFLDSFPLSFSRIILVSQTECRDSLSSKSNLTFFEAGHPIPNRISVEAAESVLSLLKELTNKDLCIILISGGGSSLLEAPDYDLTLPQYSNLIQLLLHSGASIHEINTIRKHLSKVKGEKFAIKSKATLVSLMISDVITDDPSSIASGPTVPDKTTWEDCLKILEKYGLYKALPIELISIFEKGISKEYPDTPSDPLLFRDVHNLVVGDNHQILESLKEKITIDYCASIIDYRVFGEAKEKGNELAGIAKKHLLDNKERCHSPFYFLLFGGETTVKIQADSGMGGRNQELAL